MYRASLRYESPWMNIAMSRAKHVLPCTYQYPKYDHRLPGVASAPDVCSGMALSSFSVDQHQHTISRERVNSKEIDGAPPLEPNTGWFKLIAPNCVSYECRMQWLFKYHTFSIALSAMNSGIGSHDQFIGQDLGLALVANLVSPPSTGRVKHQ